MAGVVRGGNNNIFIYCNIPALPNKYIVYFYCNNIAITSKLATLYKTVQNCVTMNQKVLSRSNPNRKRLANHFFQSIKNFTPPNPSSSTHALTHYFDNQHSNLYQQDDSEYSYMYQQEDSELCASMFSL